MSNNRDSIKYFFQSMQFFALFASSLAVPVSIASVGNFSDIDRISFISISMLAGGLATLMQSQRFKFMAPHRFLPMVPGAVYLSPTLLALQAGGLPAIMTMAFFSGLLKVVAAPTLRFLKALFPPQVTGTILLLIGIDIGLFGLANSDVHLMHLGQAFDANHIKLFSISIALTFLIFLLFTARHNIIQHYCVFVFFLIAYPVCLVFEEEGRGFYPAFANASWFHTPTIHGLWNNWSWYNSLILPFIIASIISLTTDIALVSAIQRSEDDNMDEADFGNISKAGFIDGMGNMLSGLFGGMGLNASGRGVSFSIAIEETNPTLAYGVCLIILLIAFCPKIIMLFAFLPSPLVTAILLFTGSLFMNTSFKAIREGFKRHVSSRAVAPLSIIMGIAYDTDPLFFQKAPKYMQPFMDSSVEVGAITAILLNIIFKLLEQIKTH